MFSKWLDSASVEEKRFWALFPALIVVQEVPYGIVRYPVLAGLGIALLEFCPRPEAKLILRVLLKPLELLK